MRKKPQTIYITICKTDYLSVPILFPRGLLSFDDFMFQSSHFHHLSDKMIYFSLMLFRYCNRSQQRIRDPNEVKVKEQTPIRSLTQGPVNICVDPIRYTSRKHVSIFSFSITKSTVRLWGDLSTHIPKQALHAMASN